MKFDIKFFAAIMLGPIALVEAQSMITISEPFL